MMRKERAVANKVTLPSQCMTAPMLRTRLQHLSREQSQGRQENRDPYLSLDADSADTQTSRAS